MKEKLKTPEQKKSSTCFDKPCYQNSTYHSLVVTKIFPIFTKYML